MMRNSAQLRNSHAFLLHLEIMASPDFRATSRANKRPGGAQSSSLPSREKYCFTGKRLTSQTKHVVMNVKEYFEREAKKSKGHPNILDKVCKATGKTVISLKITWINSVLYKVLARELSETFVRSSLKEQAAFHLQRRGIPVLASVRTQITSIERQYEGRFIPCMKKEKILP